MTKCPACLIHDGAENRTSNVGQSTVVRQRRELYSSRASLGHPNEKPTVGVGRDAQCTDQLAPDAFESVVVEADPRLIRRKEMRAQR
jgi:hypothetical protein